jgi:hypothetical protein
MYRSVRCTFVVVGLLMLPVAAAAQNLASIAGVVRDASGAVLPGVTVEAASPALVEKQRVVVTDDTGQYRIEALRPGPYTVTFTLTGFSTVRRDGIELTGSFTANISVQLSVGSLEETITVTGTSPVVDVQNTVQQRVVDRAVLDNVPAGREVMNIAANTVPGLVSTDPDVGGSNPNRSASTLALSIHGSNSNDQKLMQNGLEMMSARQSKGFGAEHNAVGLQEMTVDTSAASAEYASGGVRVNLIPREGGNVYSGTVFTSFTNASLQGDNLTEELIARGLERPNTVKKTWEINPGLGGPLKRDKLWFFFSTRYMEDESYVAGMYYNKNAGNPNVWTYEPDLSRPAFLHTETPEAQVRLTWQAAAAHKIGITYNRQAVNYLPSAITSLVAPEAARDNPQPGIWIAQLDWTSPLTSRVLLEAGYLGNHLITNFYAIEGGENPQMIAVMEQSTGLRYRGPRDLRDLEHRSDNFRFSLSYIPGAHAIKAGITHRSGWSSYYASDVQPLEYRFNNGVPNRITQRALPVEFQGNIDHDIGLFAQDKWTRGRLTAFAGLRFDYFTNSFSEAHIGPAVLAPNRNFVFPHQRNLVWNDLTPRLSAAYDLFGNGRTALKISANKGLQNGGGGFVGDLTVNSGNAAANALVTNATRSWTDTNRNFVPDCDLVSANANGECGRLSSANFGSVQPGTTYDPAVLRGWGVRPYNWEFSAGVQHEVVPGVAVDVGYFRRVEGNLSLTYDRNLTPADYDRFSIIAPRDPRLPDGGGYEIAGLYDLKPEKFGLPTDIFFTEADTFGKQIRHWNGVDLSVNARSVHGVLLRGGMSSGRFSTDNCDVVTRLNNPSPLYCHSNNSLLTDLKFLATYTIPRVDVLLGAVFQNLPGPEALALYNAPNADVARSLGRSLAGGAANVAVNIVEPGTFYGDRTTRLDLRLSKLLRLRGSRTMLNVDLFNALNGAGVLEHNTNYAAWQQPTAVMMARTIRLGVQFDF